MPEPAENRGRGSTCQVLALLCSFQVLGLSSSKLEHFTRKEETGTNREKLLEDQRLCQAGTAVSNGAFKARQIVELEDN